ncbi:unnamed protein product [Microthlaspi erraticum]|uniref:Uncharacterized protein n=1 Tax=Microthlaspi erraticum TaxID=1685480 RepID=A0A6D2KEX2_9BRAS|nr:unnamed protein product [Microthlaspi erraticum]
MMRDDSATCGTLPVWEEEFLTSRDDVSRRSEAHGPNLDAKDDGMLPKPEPDDYNPHAFEMRWYGVCPLMETGTLVEGRLGLPKFILLGAFRAKVWSLE